VKFSSSFLTQAFLFADIRPRPHRFWEHSYSDCRLSSLLNRFRGYTLDHPLQLLGCSSFLLPEPTAAETSVYGFHTVNAETSTPVRRGLPREQLSTFLPEPIKMDEIAQRPNAPLNTIHSRNPQFPSLLPRPAFNSLPGYLSSHAAREWCTVLGYSGQTRIPQRPNPRRVYPRSRRL